MDTLEAHRRLVKNRLEVVDRHLSIWMNLIDGDQVGIRPWHPWRRWSWRGIIRNHRGREGHLSMGLHRFIILSLNRPSKASMTSSLVHLFLGGLSLR